MQGTGRVPTRYAVNEVIFIITFRYLGKTYSGRLAGKRVLELGCGAGLPGIYCFTQWASGNSQHKKLRYLIICLGTGTVYRQLVGILCDLVWIVVLDSHEIKQHLWFWLFSLYQHVRYLTLVPYLDIRA